jgi:hypothetical protein
MSVQKEKSGTNLPNQKKKKKMKEKKKQAWPLHLTSH